MSRRWPDMRLTHDQWSTGDAIVAGISFLLGILFLLLAIALIAPYAKAHEAPMGWAYPWECCAGHDCDRISADRVRSEAGGYVVDGQFHVAQKDVRDSPDGEYHACFPKPDFLRCFWAPPAGS